MAFLQPYRSSNPTTPPVAMDHRRGPARTADAGFGGNSASMSMALVRSLVHSASAAAKGSAAAAPGAPGADRLARRREGGARIGGGSGSGGDGEAAGSAAPRRKEWLLGMPGWCSQEKGMEVVRGEGDGEEAAEEAVEKDDDEDDEDEWEAARWRR